MEEFLNNSWVIGIGGGLISAMVSSLLAYMITSGLAAVMRRKRVEEANQFVINHLRPYIIKGIIPSDTLTNALRANAAHRFKIKESDLLSLSSLIAEIAAEIVDIAYLQESDQMRYLEKIDTYLSGHLEQNNNNNQKESVQQMISVCILISFVVSSYFLVCLLRGMSETPDAFSEMVSLVQDMDNIRLFTMFLFFIEIFFFGLTSIPVFFEMFWKFGENCFAFFKNNIHKNNDK